MTLPANTDFSTKTPATAVPGLATDTGSLTWINAGGTNTSAVNAGGTAAWGGASGGLSLIPAGAHDVVVDVVPLQNGDFIGAVFACDVAGAAYLQTAIETNSPGRIRVFDKGFGTQYGVTVTPNVPAGCTVRTIVNGSSVQVLVNGVSVLTATAAVNLTNTYTGVNFAATQSSVVSFNAAAFTITAPAVTVQSYDPAGNTYASTSGSGGTGTPSYQWQRSTAPNSGFANLSNGSGISGATTATIVDGSAAALAATTDTTRLYYQCVISWSISGGPDTSNVIGSLIGKHPAQILVLGDSVTGGNGNAGPYPYWLFDAPVTYGPRTVGVTNASMGGESSAYFFNSQVDGATATCPSQAGMTSTQIKLAAGASAVDDFYKFCKVSITAGTGSGQTRFVSSYVGSTKVATVSVAWATQPDNTSVYLFSGVTSNLDAAVTAAVGAGRTKTEFRMGINDASLGHSSAVFGANVAGAAAYCLANGLSDLFTVHYPSGVADTAIMAAMLTYLPVIDALDNGATIRVGDKASFDFFNAHPELTQDGTHPTEPAGNQALAAMTAVGTATALGDAPSGTGGGVAGARIFEGF